jgi:hypothetical protein
MYPNLHTDAAFTEISRYSLTRNLTRANSPVTGANRAIISDTNRNGKHKWNFIPIWASRIFKEGCHVVKSIYNIIDWSMACFGNNGITTLQIDWERPVFCPQSIRT